jgi:hypothetical protein
MATLGGHPRHGAVIWLDGDPGLGRVGFDRSDNIAHPPNHILKNQKPTATAIAAATAMAYGIQSRSLIMRPS